jgi:drug/metabolite transporter (DMT)-like permease
MNKMNTGFSSGIILGTICLIVGIGLLIWEPGFSGFFDRGHDTQPLPIWMILLILAAFNYIYALITRSFMNRDHLEARDQPDEPHEDAGRTKQD